MGESDPTDRDPPKPVIDLDTKANPPLSQGEKRHLASKFQKTRTLLYVFGAFFLYCLSPK